MASRPIPFGRKKVRVLAEMTDSFRSTSPSGLFEEVARRQGGAKGLTKAALQSALKEGSERCSKQQSEAILDVADLPMEFAPWYGAIFRPRRKRLV